MIIGVCTPNPIKAEDASLIAPQSKLLVKKIGMQKIKTSNVWLKLAAAVRRKLKRFRKA